jgi:hypothetical protein
VAPTSIDHTSTGTAAHPTLSGWMSQSSSHRLPTKRCFDASKDFSMDSGQHEGLVLGPMPHLGHIQQAIHPREILANALHLNNSKKTNPARITGGVHRIKEPRDPKITAYLHRVAVRHNSTGLPKAKTLLHAVPVPYKLGWKSC